MKDWLRLLRISNLPTVWSSVLVPLAFAGGPRGVDFANPDTYLAVGVALVSATCLYLAGMVLNDVLDLRIDRMERPERPLPAGRINPRTATAAGVSMLGVGAILPFGLGAAAGIAATSIAVAVVAYDALHLRTAWSTVLMGICRGGIYVLSTLCLCSYYGWSDDIGFALAIFAAPMVIHVVGFSMVARHEVDNDPPISCPSCDYVVADSTVLCSECGASCEDSARRAKHEARIEVYHQWWGTATMSLVLPFALSLVVVLFLVAIMGGIGTFAYVAGMTAFSVLLVVAAVAIMGVAVVRGTRHLHRNPTAIGRFVLRSIRNISLYDACILLFLLGIHSSTSSIGGPPASTSVVLALALGCYFATMAAHRRIPGT